MFFIVNVVAHFHFGQGRNRMQTLQKRFQCVLTLILAQKSRRVLFVLTTSSGRNHTLKFQVRQVCFKNGVFPVFFQKTASNRYTSVIAISATLRSHSDGRYPFLGSFRPNCVGRNAFLGITNPFRPHFGQVSTRENPVKH